MSASIGAGTSNKKLKFRCSKSKFLEFCDLNKRVKMQDKDGAVHEILLPNLGLLWRIKNKKVKKLCFKIYNDYAIAFEKNVWEKDLVYCQSYTDLLLKKWEHL